MNRAQQDFLDTLVGIENGCYTGTVLDNQKTPYEIRVFYLYRAVHEPTTTFLASLDKLFNPFLENLELVRVLKTINDLANNAELHLQVGSKLRAIPHYFGALGATDDVRSFTDSVKTMVEALVMDACIKKPALRELAFKRHQAETYIKPLSDWRASLNLPLSQQTFHQVYSWQRFTTFVRKASDEAFDFFEAFFDAIHPAPFDEDDEAMPNDTEMPILTTANNTTN